jgi:hypothetical protein
MRSVRTVLLLIAATALYLVAAQLPLAIGIPVRTVVIAGCLWAMLLHPTWFVAMRLGDRIFDTAYSAVLEDLRALADRRMSGDIGIPQFVTELEDLALRLEQLAPPNQQWEALRGRTVAHLRSQLRLFRQAAQGNTPSASALTEAESEMERLRNDYRRLRDDAFSFSG